MIFVEPCRHQYSYRAPDTRKRNDWYRSSERMIPQVVSMHSIIASKISDSKFELPVAFGRTITNDIFMVDLPKYHTLLVAGATGQ